MSLPLLWLAGLMQLGVCVYVCVHTCMCVWGVCVGVSVWVFVPMHMRIYMVFVCERTCMCIMCLHALNVCIWLCVCVCVRVYSP